MDRSHVHGGTQPQNTIHTQSRIPPWHKAQRQPLRSRDVVYRQVDSWRSYKTDATNLQTSTQSNLQATALPFEPLVTAQSPCSHSTPYESLRISNGVAERAVVEAANGTSNVAKKKKKSRSRRQASSVPPLPAAPDVAPSSGFASRYPMRANRSQADDPLPSIELSRDESLSNATTNPINKPQSERRFGPSPKPPNATEKYLSQALQEPVRLLKPKKLLVVLDLNGTLLYRSRSSTAAKPHMRPGVTPFLDYLFTNHAVMVYTSALPQTATNMVNKFLQPNHRKQLAAVWARDKLDLTAAQFGSKVQVYKKLEKVWNDPLIQVQAEGSIWDQSNTVLIDDSKLKALSQPHNLLQVPEYTSEDDPAKHPETHKLMYQAQQEIVQQLQSKLEDLKYQVDVSRLIRRWQTGEEDAPRLPCQKVVVEETVDQKDVKQQGELSIRIVQKNEPKSHLLTPSSSRNSESVERQVSKDDNLDAGSAPPSPISLRESSTVSSIDEDVFREVLEGTGK